MCLRLAMCTSSSYHRRTMLMPTYKQQQGFTIVELLIVVVVIAILAAISVVAYTNIQNRTYDSAVESDVSAIIKKMEIAKMSLGHYPYTSTEFEDGFKFSKSAYDGANNNIYYIVDKDTDRYAIGLRSKSGRGYIINTGVMIRDAGPISAAKTAEPLGIDWGTSNDPINDPPRRAVLQGYVGNTTSWSSGWKWTN